MKNHCKKNPANSRISVRKPCNSWLVVFICALFGMAPFARAERKFILGAQVSLMAGGTNQITDSSLAYFQTQSSLSQFIGLYPSVDLKAVGRRSQMNFSYTAQGDYYKEEQIVMSVTHNAGANLNFQAGKNVRLALNGSFSNVPDYASLNVYKGLTLTPWGFQYVYEPTLAQRTSRDISGGGTIDWSLANNSQITMAVYVYLRNYEKNDLFKNKLSDQARYEGKLSFSHKMGERRTLSFSYDLAENTFLEYSNARTHSATFSYSHQLTPNTKYSIEAGPSLVDGSMDSKNYFGYFASAQISRKIRSSQASFNFSHRTGDSTGLGGVSETQSAGLSLSCPFGRRISATVNATAYDSHARLDNPYNTRSFSGALNMSYALGRRWSLGIGGSYRNNEGIRMLNNEYKRIFLSLAYNAPDLWRFSR
jgi:hypothetical protein